LPLRTYSLLTVDGSGVSPAAARPPAAARESSPAPGVMAAPATTAAGPAATTAAAAETTSTPAAQTTTPAEPTPAKTKQNSLGLFFRKFYYLASVRLRDICERLKLMDDVRETIWTVFEYAIVNHVTVMQGRHLDQLIMSSIFVVCKAFGINKKFTDIMGMYRCQPQAKSHVYRSVLLGATHKEGGEPRTPAPTPDPAIKATPVACPPTPSRMAGTVTSYQLEGRQEERGDIIQFYNQVFVDKVKAFVSKFNKSDGKPPLSPLPSPRHSPMPVRRNVSAKHSIYISPLKQSPGRFTDRLTVRSYSFNRSPAHELRSINAMVRPPPGSERPPPAGDASPQPVRRPLLAPDDAGEPEPKRYKARLRNVLDQRQATVGE